VHASATESHSLAVRGVIVNRAQVLRSPSSFSVSGPVKIPNHFDMESFKSYLPFSRFDTKAAIAQATLLEEEHLPTSCPPSTRRDCLRLMCSPVEDRPQGYPQFTALLSAYDPFLICRRFTRLRARLLLLKQDKLSVLEQRLDEVDQQEKSLIFLGKSRCDRNADRAAVLSDIESSLVDYGGVHGTCML